MELLEFKHERSCTRRGIVVDSFLPEHDPLDTLVYFAGMNSEPPKDTYHMNSRHPEALRRTNFHGYAFAQAASALGVAVHVFYQAGVCSKVNFKQMWKHWREYSPRTDAILFEDAMEFLESQKVIVGTHFEAYHSYSTLFGLKRAVGMEGSEVDTEGIVLISTFTGVDDALAHKGKERTLIPGLSWAKSFAIAPKGLIAPYPFKDQYWQDAEGKFTERVEAWSGGGVVRTSAAKHVLAHNTYKLAKNPAELPTTLVITGRDRLCSPAGQVTIGSNLLQNDEKDNVEAVIVDAGHGGVFRDKESVPELVSVFEKVIRRGKDHPLRPREERADQLFLEGASMPHF
jgi:hypothetical protein